MRASLAAWAMAPGISTVPDRKSTRLNSSHLVISYAVFCLKKHADAHQGRQALRAAGRRPERGDPQGGARSEVPCGEGKLFFLRRRRPRALFLPSPDEPPSA